MLILRIRQAEVALADGRLDEVFGLAQLPNLRAHRRGQRIVTELAKALVKRGQAHLKSERYIQALGDCEKAETVAGSLPEISELRAAATDAMLEQQSEQRQRAATVAAAKKQIEFGHLSVGERMLGSLVTMESRAAVLMQDVNAKKSQVDHAVKAATMAISRDDMEGAVKELLNARQADANDSRVGELVAKASSKLREKLSDAFNTGRLDLTQPLLTEYAKLTHDGTDAQQFRKAIEQCHHAWQCLDKGQPSHAAEILKRLAIIFPQARWMESAMKHLKVAADALEELRSGPLGLTDAARAALNSPTLMPATLRPTPRANQFAPQVKQVANIEADPTGALPFRFMLRVDGAGSYCVLRNTSVMIGPVSSAHAPDLGLIAEPGIAPATIDRVDDEYFIRGSMVAVNDAPAPSRMLKNADRIALSPRCRMTFSVPSVASTTAVLDLNGARFPRADVRRVILLDSDLIIGQGASTHVRVDDSTENLVLHLRQGRLFCESKLPVEVNGAPMDRQVGIPLGAHVRVGAVSFVVSRE